MADRLGEAHLGARVLLAAAAEPAGHFPGRMGEEDVVGILKILPGHEGLPVFRADRAGEWNVMAVIRAV